MKIKQVDPMKLEVGNVIAEVWGHHIRLITVTTAPVYRHGFAWLETSHGARNYSMITAAYDGGVDVVDTTPEPVITPEEIEVKSKTVFEVRPRYNEPGVFVGTVTTPRGYVYACTWRVENLTVEDIKAAWKKSRRDFLPYDTTRGCYC